MRIYDLKKKKRLIFAIVSGWDLWEMWSLTKRPDALPI